MDMQTRSNPVARARELAAEIAAAAGEIESTRRIPSVLLGRLNRLYGIPGKIDPTTLHGSYGFIID